MANVKRSKDAADLCSMPKPSNPMRVVLDILMSNHCTYVLALQAHSGNHVNIVPTPQL